MPRFHTPPDIPEGIVSRRFDIPNSRAWLSLFSEALSQTIYPYNYDQADTANLTPDQAAAKAYEVYEAWLLADEATGGDCPPPEVTIADGTRQRIHRKNPTTGRHEVLNSDGTWAEPAGDAAIPEPAARAELTTQERLCAAATNAANVVRLTYETFLDDLNNEVDDQQMQINMAAGIAAALAGTLAIPVAADIALNLAGWNVLVETGQTLTPNLWNDGFHQRYICCLKSNATDTAGVVTFDFWGVNECLAGMLFNLQDYLLLIGQVSILHILLGAQGLNLAGATTALAGDCASCGTWAREFDFAYGQMGWTDTNAGDTGDWNVAGYWQTQQDVAGNKGIIIRCDPPGTSFTVKRIYAIYRVTTTAGWTDKIIGAYPSGSTGLGLAAANADLVHDTGYTLDYVNPSYLNFRLWRPASSGAGVGYLKKVIVWGSGTMPFTAVQGMPYTGTL